MTSRLPILAAVSLVAIGCNAILGNDVHELAAPAPQDGDEMTLDDATDGDVTIAETGAPEDTGAPDDTGALEDTSPPCSAGMLQCMGGNVNQCIAGQWIQTVQCPFTCLNGGCTGVCVPGTKQCSGLTPQTCDSTGQWLSGASCPNLCSLGECAGMCVPNSMLSCGNATTCNAAAVQTCDGSGTWGTCLPAPSDCLALPAGWQAVAMTHDSCPDGFGTGQTYLTSATGAAFTCTCGCSGTQACAGSFTLNQYGVDGGATCDGTPTTRTNAVTPACVSANYGAITAGSGYTISAVTYGPAPSCTAAPTPTVQPQVTTASVTLCSANDACPSGACLSMAQSANLCLAKPGTNTCPAEYPTRTLMAPTYDDTRSCGPCTCGSTLTCDLTGVLLDNDAAGCSTTGHPYWMIATTACAQAPSTYPLNAVQAVGSSAGSGTCAATSPSSPTGGVALHDASTITVCCK